MFANLLPLLVIASIASNVLPARAAEACTAFGAASYTITYTAVWANPPSVNGSRYSQLVGMCDSDSSSLFTVGKKVKPRMKMFFENGSQVVFYFNATSLETCSPSYPFFLPDIEMANGTTKGYLNATKAFPLVSALAMLAPSPDWFVGVKNVNLCNGSHWLAKVTTNVYPYDAGTDSGKQWTSSDEATVPQDPVTRLYTSADPDHAFRNYSNATWGTVTFKLVGTMSVNGTLDVFPTKAGTTKAGTTSAAPTNAGKGSSQTSVHTHLSVPLVLCLVFVVSAFV